MKRSEKMIKSMTGFGRCEMILDGRDIIVEIKSVNHRYFEYSSRIQRNYSYIDEKIKSYVSGVVSRGKVEVGVVINNTCGTEEIIKVNTDIAMGYVNALKKANEEIGIVDDLALSHIMRLPDVFNITKAPDDEEQIWESVRVVLEKAVESFIEMRKVEGEKMYQDITSRLSYLESSVALVEKQSPETTKKYRERLYNKLKEVLSDNNIDDSLIVTEAAIFSEKTAVDEETVRLRSHISQFSDLIASDIPVGRKLDFLVQEINREVNTIGSKAQDLSITKCVVDMKSEIEKMREQIQNIE